MRKASRLDDRIPGGFLKEIFMTKYLVIFQWCCNYGNTIENDFWETEEVSEKSIKELIDSLTRCKGGGIITIVNLVELVS
jgi:hypothetical protein